MAGLTGINSIPKPTSFVGRCLVGAISKGVSLAPRGALPKVSSFVGNGLNSLLSSSIRFSSSASYAASKLAENDPAATGMTSTALAYLSGGLGYCTGRLTAGALIALGDLSLWGAQQEDIKQLRHHNLFTGAFRFYEKAYGILSASDMGHDHLVRDVDGKMRLVSDLAWKANKLGTPPLEQIQNVLVMRRFLDALFGSYGPMTEVIAGFDASLHFFPFTEIMAAVDRYSAWASRRDAVKELTEIEKSVADIGLLLDVAKWKVQTADEWVMVSERRKILDELKKNIV